MFETFLNPPALSFNPLEFVIIYGLLIFTISAIVTEKVIDWLKIKSITAKASSFLLMSALLFHLVFVEQNSFVESIMIIGILIVSFGMTVLHKTLFPARKVAPAG